MMQVEEKLDVTYSDVGGCKEQIKKLWEVVETPLLSVCGSFQLFSTRLFEYLSSQNTFSTSVLIHPRVFFSLVLQVQEGHCVLVL